MAGVKKTAKELAEMVADEIGVHVSAVKVFKDKTYGWRPEVYVAPQHAETIKQAADEAARELRTKYALAD